MSTGSNHLSRNQWVKRLNREWRDLKDTTVEGFFEFGRSLILAKTQLDRGEWLALIKTGDLEFKKDVVQAFLRIATWGEQKRSNAQLSSIIGKLPPDYTTIGKLVRLDKTAPETFQRLIEDGTICPSLQRNEVAQILWRERVTADEERVLKLVPVRGKFRTLIFDPAWEYEQSVAGRAKPDYALQSLDQLRALDIKQWADEEVGTHLYACATNSFLKEAFKLIELWGFQYRDVITWIKPPPFGVGSLFRNTTEQILFATLGDTLTRPAAASIPTHFEAPRGKHSEKPERFYDIVRAASYPPYGEGNQCRARPDFTNLFVEVAEAAE